MGNAKEKRSISEWWAGLKAEFGKIIWLDRVTLGKQTTAVIIVSVSLGIIIVILDMLIQRGMDFLVGL